MLLSTAATSIAGGLLRPQQAVAANDAWSTSPGSSFFSSSGGPNWTTGATTGAAATGTAADGDALYFDNSTLTNLNNDNTGISYAGLTFNSDAAAYTIAGNAFTLTGNLTNASGNTETISTPITISGTDAVALTAGGAAMVISGNLSGNGTLNQTGQFSGVNRLTLSGTNTGFTGAFTADNSAATRTTFTTAAAGSASAAWTFNRTVGGGAEFNFSGATINFGALSGGGFIRGSSAFTGTTLLSVGALGTTTTFSGQIQTNSNNLLSLAKVGTGALELTGSNSYTGATTISGGGTLILGNGVNIASSSGVTLGESTNNTIGALQLGDANAAAAATIGTLAFAGTGTGNGVVGGNAGVSTLTFSSGTGGLTVGSFFGGAGTNQNNLAIIKTGTGALTLTNANTLVGSTQINAGNLNLTGLGSAGSSAITVGAVNGGATNTALTIAPTTTSGTLTRGTSLTVNGNVGTGSNYANLTVTGAAANTNDTFTGSLSLNSGSTRLTLSPNAAGNLALTFGGINRNPGTTLVVNATPGVNTIASTTANASNLIFSTAPTMVGGNGGLASTTTSILPYVFVNSTSTNSSVFSTYTASNGLQTLTNTASGITDGTVSANNVNLSNSGNTQTINTGATINSLQLGGSPTAAIIGGTGTLTVASGAVDFTQAATLNVGTLAFGSAEGIVFVQNTRLPAINSSISGSNGLTVDLIDLNNTTAGVVLNGTNAYTGITTFEGNNSSMTVRLTNSLALQNTTLDYNNYGASFTFGNGTTTGQSAYTFGGLKGTQNINLNNNNATVGPVALTIGSAGSTDTAATVNNYGGVLSNTVAGGSVIIAGPATEVFSGVNTYSGGTTISGGKLRITNPSGSATGTGLVAISGGSNATLTGIGFATGGVTATNSSRIAPGINTTDADGSGRFNFGSAGSISLTGGLTLTNANLDFDLSATHGSGNDSILTSGVLTLGTVSLNFNELNSANGATALETGVPYILISNATSVTSNSFAGLSTNFIGSELYTASYSTSGTDLEVTFSSPVTAPEPGCAALLAMGTIGLFGRRRRRNPNRSR